MLIQAARAGFAACLSAEANAITSKTATHYFWSHNKVIEWKVEMRWADLQAIEIEPNR